MAARTFVHEGQVGGTPLSSIYNLYADGTAGNDANNGGSWAQAFRTTSKLLSAIRSALITLPTDVQILGHIRHAFANQDLIFNLPTTGMSRVNIVHDVSEMTEAQVLAVLATGGDAHEHGMERVQVDAVPNVQVGTYVGRTVQFEGTGAGAGETFCATCVRQDVAGPNFYIWVTVNQGSLPAWVAAGVCNVNVLLPDTFIDGTCMMMGIGAPLPFVAMQRAVAPDWRDICSYAVNIRARNFVMMGSLVGLAGCLASSDGAAYDGDIYGGQAAALATYWRSTAGSADFGMTDVIAQAIGLWAGTTPPANNTWTFGNTCRIVSSQAAQYIVWSGYADSQVRLQGGGNMICWNSASPRFDAGVGATTGGPTSLDGGQMIVQRAIVVGNANGPQGLGAYGGGVLKFDRVTLDNDLAITPIFIASEFAGYVESMQGHIDQYDGVAHANAPATIALAHGGTIKFRDSYPDALIGATNQMVVEAGGWIHCQSDHQANAIDLVTARPGGGTDILVSCGKMTVRGDIQKTVPNGQASGFIEVGTGSQLVQESGNLDHGVAPADWAAAYGAGRLIYVHDGGQAHFGQVADGGVGVGASVAVEIRRHSLLTFTAGGLGLTGAGPVQVGAAAAPIAWPAAWSSDDAAAGNATEFCAITPR